MSESLTLPNDTTNLHRLAVQHCFNHRRASDGTVRQSLCEPILSVPQASTARTMSAATAIMDQDETQRKNRSHSMSPRGTLRAVADQSGHTPQLSISQCYTRSGSSSPCSDTESSIASCSDLVAALESLALELQEQRLSENKPEDEDNDLTTSQASTENEKTESTREHTPIVRTSSGPGRSGTPGGGGGRDDGSLVGSIGPGRMSPVKSLGHSESSKSMAEKEKILNECMNQIKTLKAANKTLEKKLLEKEEAYNHAIAHKVPCRENLKCWSRTRGNAQDMEKKLALTDDYVEPSEIIAVLLASERRYVTALSLLNSHFHLPMRMLSSYQPEILSMQQLNTIFLNCNELLVLHRGLYEDLLQVSQIPESAQVDKLFEILEGTFRAFSCYSSFLNGNRQQNIQRELRQLKSKPKFDHLLNHCEQNCEGTSLTTLLNMPAERLSEYSELLTNFLNPRVRALPEDATKRAEALIRFLRNLRYDLSEEKSDWDHTLEKIKLLNKLVTDGPIPLDIFNSDVRLVKQGPLTQVLGKKETPRHCILFNNFIALAQAKDNQYRISENAMISLYGAQLHKCVDVEGQAIGSDFQSGRQEDRLAFGLTLVNNESLYLRAGKPNEWKQWVEMLEKCIQESQKLRLELEMDAADHRPLFPVETGPKIAAASLEKLFQQLTSPHFEHQDFMRVFLLTHSCFTTAKDVLTALLNCIKSPEDSGDRNSLVSEAELFLFMEDVSAGSGSVSGSPSTYTINTDSELGSPAPSPSVVRRSAASTHSNGMSVSPSPNSLLRTGNSARKAVHSAASFASTDSDISPHTSAIVVDNAPVSTKDGWAEGGDPDITTRKRLGGKMTLPNFSPSNESDYYSKLIPSSRVLVESEASDVEGDAFTDKTLSPSESLTTSVRIDPTRSIRRHTRRTLSESADYSIYEEGSPGTPEDQSLRSALANIEPSERMHRDLDEASKLMDNMMESLDTEFGSEESGSGRDVVRRRSRTLSGHALNRLGIISTLSNSEPDLTGCNVDEDLPPPLPPGHPNADSKDSDILTKEEEALGQLYRKGGLIRRGSEHSLLSYSLNMGHNPIYSGQGDKAFTREVKAKLTETKGKGKKVKKADTFSGRGTPPTASLNLMSSPSRSSNSSMFLGSSPMHHGNSLAPSTSFTSDLGGRKKTSMWANMKNKIKKKNFSRAPSVSAEPDEGRHKPQRSQSIPSSKKIGVYPRNGSISVANGEELTGPEPSGGSMVMVSPRRRASNAVPGGPVATNDVNLVSKIFSVLKCWVEEYFEDFQDSTELTNSLTDFLETLITKTSCDRLEYHRAHQLLDELKKRLQYSSLPEPNCPFFVLLSRVIRLTPEVLSMYDWDNPDKLMKGREIDLGKSLPKESTCLKMIAEQLTLMEYSVYSVIRRKELLNCNWKKPNKEQLAPNVCRLIRRTNDMTSWVATEILQRKTPSQRAVVIEHFIQIANYCYKHNDLHCALNITIALGSACIKSLKQTWNEVDRKYRQRYEKLRFYMDYHGKCRKMRENLEKLTQDSLNKTGKLPAALPYIGAYLDVIYTHEMQHKTYNQNGLVNFQKMTQLAEMVTNVLQYQSVGFSFEPNPDMMAYVTAAKRLSENELYELSMTAEQRSN